MSKEVATCRICGESDHPDKLHRAMDCHKHKRMCTFCHQPKVLQLPTDILCDCPQGDSRKRLRPDEKYDSDTESVGHFSDSGSTVCSVKLAANACRNWAKNGECKWGDECKFDHNVKITRSRRADNLPPLDKKASKETKAKPLTPLEESLKKIEDGIKLKARWGLSCEPTQKLIDLARELRTNVEFKGGPHGHPQSAMVRRVAEAHMYASFPLEWTAMSIGGSAREDAYKQVKHRCNPMIDDCDAMRDVAGQHVCDHTAFECNCFIPDVYTATHVYLSPDDVTHLVRKSFKHKVYMVVHNIHPKKVYWDGEATSVVLRDGTSQMVFGEQPPYNQWDMKWLSRFSHKGIAWKVIGTFPHTFVLEFREGVGIPPPAIMASSRDLFPNLAPTTIKAVRDLMCTGVVYVLYRYPDRPPNQDLPIILNPGLCNYANVRAMALLRDDFPEDRLRQLLVSWIRSNVQLDSPQYADALAQVSHVVKFAIEEAALEDKNGRKLLDESVDFPEAKLNAEGKREKQSEWAIVRRVQHLRHLQMEALRRWRLPELATVLKGLIVAYTAWQARGPILKICDALLHNKAISFNFSNTCSVPRRPAMLANIADHAARSLQSEGLFQSALKLLADRVFVHIPGILKSPLNAVVIAPLWEEWAKRRGLGNLLPLFEIWCNNGFADENLFHSFIHFAKHKAMEALPYWLGVMAHSAHNIGVLANLGVWTEAVAAARRGGVASYPRILKMLCTLPMNAIGTIAASRKEVPVNIPTHPDIVRAHTDWRDDMRVGIVPMGPCCRTVYPIVPSLSTANEYAAIVDRMLRVFPGEMAMHPGWVDYILNGARYRIKPNRAEWIARFPPAVRDRLNADFERAKVDPAWARKEYLRRSMFVKHEKLPKMSDVDDWEWKGPRPVEPSNGVANNDQGPSFYATSKLYREEFGVSPDESPFGAGPGVFTYGPGLCSEDVALWLHHANANGLTKKVFIDCNRFDASCRLASILETNNFFSKLGWSRARLARIARFHKNHKFRSSSGIKVSTEGHVSTGYSGTSVGNSTIMLAALTSMFIHQQERFSPKHKEMFLNRTLFMLIVAGDDSITAVPEDLVIDWEYIKNYGFSPKVNISNDDDIVDYLSGRFHRVRPYLYKGVVLDRVHGPKVGKQLLKIGWDISLCPPDQLPSKLKGELLSHAADWSVVPILSEVVTGGLASTGRAKPAYPTRDSIYFPRPVQEHEQHPDNIIYFIANDICSVPTVHSLKRQLLTNRYPFLMRGAEELLLVDQ
jgi:hypothetical protein